MQCRPGCGACCIAPSISTPMPDLPNGKPAGQRCLHLQADLSCALFHDPRRPAVCAAFKPERQICGDSQDQALRILNALEEG